MGQKLLVRNLEPTSRNTVSQETRLPRKVAPFSRGGGIFLGISVFCQEFLRNPSEKILEFSDPM